eukprot:1018131-Ditylum_brightwellii.AAC.1
MKKWKMDVFAIVRLLQKFVMLGFISRLVLGRVLSYWIGTCAGCSCLVSKGALKLGGAGKALAEYSGTATPPNTLGQSGAKYSSCTGMVKIGGGWCVGL